MKKHLILGTLLGVLGIQVSQAQEKYQPGFVITLEGDSLRGELLTQSSFANYKEAIFRQGDFIKTYYPFDIQGFGYVGGRYFHQLSGMDSFVQALVLGYMSLYKQDNRYYLEKEGEWAVAAQVFGLKSIVEDVSASLTFMDCLDEKDAFITQLDDKSVIEKVILYNNCKNSSYRVLRNELPALEAEFGLTGGVVLGQLITKEDVDPRGIMPDQYQTWDATFGLSVMLEFPRTSENLFVESGIHWMDQQFVGYTEDVYFNQTDYHDTQIDLRYLQLPFLVGYQSSSFPSKFRFKGGAVFMAPLETSFIKTTDIERNGLLNRGEPAEVWELEPWFLGLSAGVGYRYELGKFAIGVEGTYTRTLDLESNTLYSIQLQMYSASLQFIFL
ncbi:MAG TPA: hypothetical protein DCE41_19140 [Cytophagales bacterium]|nr:hypothetical protein [Cytophagales bacterium]HAA19679.1 hypothetical protein [Cytophagales bacterium]HAP62695.1 hypothetical protein [Cytophagales bacterium]